ncbi:MAG TPA: ATP-binding cassette domain-containing protein [Deltaproteobacteria bacterium]|nr:ATP-binding cassette domain-containing protein [Deltaproteobacteria bacterium]HPJ93874.1 ATP-binding cassette domain-containing protein [Deltaproteobacteria bacterium]HPR51846.1 ATP-binding cassette domain-containing protein [Deltaproteobacteria bacterium]
MIILEDVTKAYHGNVYALRDVSIHIKKGECCFLLGPSGAGKTTLLKLMYALERPSNGQVYIQDRDISGMDSGSIQAIRRRTGYVFQDYKLINDWSVYDNAAIILEILGKSSIYIRSRVWKMLKWVGLQHKVYERAGDLSGGEQQRLALVRSIIHDPDILLADEPVGSLDETMGRYIMNMFYKLHKKGMTVVIASHKEDPIIDFARVIRMDKGKVVGG